MSPIRNQLCPYPCQIGKGQEVSLGSDYKECRYSLSQVELEE